MNISDLPKPWLYKDKWMIWPESVLDIMNIADCDDTINGICLVGKTIQECIDQCIGECGAGYHIQFKDNKSVCVPIRTSIHPYLNPVHRIRKQSIYPELKNVKVSTFINTDIFPFPPEYANVVFVRDIITMKETINGKTIKTKHDEIKNKELIYMDSDEDNNNITLLPTNVYAGQVSEYIPVLYGDPIQICIPNTSLIARVTDLNALEWDIGFFNGNDLSFRIMPIDSSKKIGDVITFDDKFAIIYSNNSVVILNPNYNYLQLENDNLQDILENKKFIATFQFISKMKGYYCDGNQCKLVPIKDIQTLGPAGRYKGVTVGKNPGCWGVCNYLIPGTNDTYPLSTIQPSYIKYQKIYWIIIGMIMIILSIIFIRIFKKKN